MKAPRAFVAWLILGVLAFMVVPDVYGQALQRHPTGSDETTGYWCFDCHEFENDPPNARWVKTQIDLKPPKTGTVTVDYPVQGAFVKDVSPYNGPCQVCHTETNHYRSDGSRIDHFVGSNCMACHSHFQVNMFTWSYIGGQSHETHLVPDPPGTPDPKGPAIQQCTVCHESDFNGFGPDGDSLEDTDVCDPCHSPGGDFNGSAEGKAKWEDGVYEENGYQLKAGNENWCATCHDDGSSIVNGVSAPNVMGDNTVYGYNVSGHGPHGVRCEDCHDLTLTHTDGVERTYSASSDNYNEGYRLDEDMAVPRNGEIGSVAFNLCTSCHNYGDLIGTFPITTGFREGEIENHHNRHLETTGWENDFWWDSDYDGALDSAMSCPACHNIHGSPMDAGGTLFPNPVMIRHGELIGHVPAFDFQWRKDGWNGTPTALYEESACGGMKCGNWNDPTKTTQQQLAVNHVCIACHYGYDDPPYEPYWYCRTTETVTIESVWVSNTTYEPGDPITYNVRFKITGAGSYHTKLYKSRAFNLSGTDWETKIQKHKTLSAGTYQWSLTKTIPGVADPGSGAKVVMQVRIYTGVGGTLLDNDKEFTTFSIQAP